MSFEEGLGILKETFSDYIKTKVLSEVEKDNLGKQNVSIRR